MRRYVLVGAIGFLALPALLQAQPIAAPGTECLRVIVNTPGEVIATYRGNSATYSNDLYFSVDCSGDETFIFNNHSSPVGSEVNLGSFPIGTELCFRLFVRNTGYSYYTGPADRNPDNRCHARVQAEWRPGESLVSFEDLYNGPFHYNDLSFSFTNTDTCAVVCDPGGPYQGDAGVPVQFDGSASFSTCSGIVAWEWNFGDGTTGSGMTPTHTYERDGQYPVELCVTDERGETACCVLGDRVVPEQPWSWGRVKASYR